MIFHWCHSDYNACLSSWVTCTTDIHVPYEQSTEALKRVVFILRVLCDNGSLQEIGEVSDGGKW